MFIFVLVQENYKRYMMQWDGVDPEDSPWEEEEKEEYAPYKVRIQLNAEELVGGTPFAKPFWVSPALVPTYKESDYRRWNEVEIIILV